MTRRDDREYREYLREEQRSQRGCIAGRMQLDFYHGLLNVSPAVVKPAIEWTLELRITLNGDAHEVAGPLTVTALLDQLGIDARRVAVEHNLVVLKRDAFPTTMVREGDEIEIVNFVGGG